MINLLVTCVREKLTYGGNKLHIFNWMDFLIDILSLYILMLERSLSEKP